MKKLLICIMSFICLSQAIAQNNVGINTTNPQATLDVRGSQRIGGNLSFMHFDSTTGRIQWGNAHLYVPVSQQIIRHSASSEGLYAGGGRLEYRNATEPVFFSDWISGNGYFKDNLGIGSLTPYAPLTFKNGNGPKISLTGIVSRHHGFGVQDDVLQVYSESTPGSGIAFGSHTNSTFNEFMRINTGAGRVGIGTSIPRGMLHVSNGNSGVVPLSSSMLVLESVSHAYMSLLSPTAFETGILFGNQSGNTSGGIIYGNSSNLNGFQFRNNGNLTKMVLDNQGRLGIGNLNPNAPLAFPPALGKKITLYPGASGDVGFAVQGNLLQIYSDNPNADIAFGYDQAGVLQETFRMSANGSLAVNGTTGAPGQILQSNGATSPASWTQKPYVLYFNAGDFSLLQGALCVDIPGIANGAITLTQHSYLTYQFTIPLYWNIIDFGPGFQAAAIVVQIWNSSGTMVSNATTSFILNVGESLNVIASGIADLAAGNYSVLAKLIRKNTVGSWFHPGLPLGNPGACNDFPRQTGQLIIQVFPK